MSQTVVNLVTLKAGAEHELLFNKRASRWQHLLTSEMEQRVTKIVFLTLMNLVTLKAGAKLELLFNKPASR